MKKKLLFVVCRGAWDATAIVIPTGDPGSDKRKDLLEGSALPMNGFWSLNPLLPKVHAMAQAGEAVFIHAVATPYRDERSHFSGQQVLESGGSAPFELKTGFLNRLLAAANMDGAASGLTVPISLIGPVPVPSYNKGIPRIKDAVAAGIKATWQSDVEFAKILGQVQDSESIAIEGYGEVPLVVGLLKSPVGPDVVTVETIGWDTHVNQRYTMAGPLRDLDAFLDAVRSGLGEQWSETLVVVCSEFGRTITLNGTGTDHGTGSMCMLLGAVKNWNDVSKPVVADWPGLAVQNLLNGRDLKPTKDLRSVLLAAIARHFAINPDIVSPVLFPSATPVVADASILVAPSA